MRGIYKCIILFFIFGAMYYAIEIAFDGSSHWTMFMLGGICGVFGDLLNEYRPRMKILTQCVLITFVILTLEYITGLIVNLYLGLGVWDYSGLPFNLQGQICLTFAIIWFIAFSPLIIWLGDTLRHLIWQEEKPMALFRTYLQLFEDMFHLVQGRRRTAKV